MRLIITRHGETEENKKHILQGHMPGTLSKLGIEQAKKVALRLKDEKIDAIYSSDLARAADTAKEIIKFHPDSVVEYLKDLREGDFGKYTGQTNVSIDWANRPKEFETKAQIRVRAQRVIDMAYEKYPESTVLLVMHDGIYQSFRRIIFNRPDDERFEKFNNAAVSIFEIKEDEDHVVHLMNCDKHLKD